MAPSKTKVTPAVKKRPYAKRTPRHGKGKNATLQLGNEDTRPVNEESDGNTDSNSSIRHTDMADSGQSTTGFSEEVGAMRGQRRGSKLSSSRQY